MLVSGSYFPTLGLKPGAGPPARPRGRRDDRRRIRRRPELRLLGVAGSAADPSVVGKTIVVNGQIDDDHRRRRRAASTARSLGVAADGLRRRSPCARRCRNGAAGVREPARATGSTCSAGSSRASSLEQARTALNAVYRPIINDVEAPLQKGMSDADAWRFKAKEIAVEYGAPRTELGAQGGEDAAAHAVRRHRDRAAHRLRQHRQPAAGARRGPRHGDGRAARARRQPPPAAGPAAHRVGAARPDGRRREPPRGAVDARRLIASLLPPDAARPRCTSQLQPSVVAVRRHPRRRDTGLLFGLFPALHSTRPTWSTAIRANAGQISGHARRGAVPHHAGHGADRAVDGAADLRPDSS